MDQPIGSGASECEMLTSRAYTLAEGMRTPWFPAVYVRLLPGNIHVIPHKQHCPLAYNLLSMKLSITPAEVSGYSLSSTSSLAIKVLG